MNETPQTVSDLPARAGSQYGPPTADDRQRIGAFLRAFAERIENEQAASLQLDEASYEVQYDWAEARGPDTFVYDDLSNRYLRGETATLRLHWKLQP